ncbi:AtpZ/AtpI family protein [Maribacter sp.]|uniref:AtpZ/AtpI family protein n=1 Tax=Maribacter sp. TaxID=1897614 RepID=UPI0025C738F4|nr:AtpZ/AtpI family protein [Maribacter sp.]
MSENNKEKNQNSKKQLNSYIKFSGVAFQMIAIICVFSYFGIWLDEKFPNNYSAYTIIFSLIGVISAMYLVIKQVMSMNKDKK